MARRSRTAQAESDLGMEPDAVESYHASREDNLRSQASKSKFAKYGKYNDDDMLSDEEVMGVQRASDISDDDDDADIYGGNEQNEDEGIDDWGTTRNNYYGADDAENDEDAKFEEQEAMRLQKKKLGAMKKSDFFEEDDFKAWEESAKDAEKVSADAVDDEDDDFIDPSKKKILEALPTSDPKKLTASERMTMLETLYPEVLPLSEELSRLGLVLENIKKEIKDFEDKSNSTQDTTESESDSIEQKIYSVNKLKHASLSAYLGSLSTYFALFVVNLTGSDKINLKEHPVMEGILRCKELWNSVKDLKIIGLDDDEDLEVSSFDNKSIKSLGDKLDDSDSSEDEGDIFDTDALIKSAVKSSQKKLAAAATKRKRVKSESDSEFEEEGAFADFFDSDDNEEEEEENDDNLEARGEDYDSDLELEAPITNLSIKKSNGKLKKHNPADDYGESADMNFADLDDKMQRKRNLRYYTSKIDQASKKNMAKLTGDSDLPYKERASERERRLAEEARLRGLKHNKDDEADRFSDSDNDEKPSKPAKSSTKEDEEAEAYYNTVKEQASLRRQSKRDAHAMAEKARKQGKLDQMLEDETIGEDGKRAITYQILKNKGIKTGKTKKENRNSRVKKRVRYEEAQKKLKSVRRVYTQPTAAYAGEQTGIKKNLSRSVKFSS